MNRLCAITGFAAVTALVTAACTTNPSGPAGTVSSTSGSTSSRVVTQTVKGCETDTERPLVTLVAPDDAKSFAVTLWPPDRNYQTIALRQCVFSIVDACEGPLDVADAAQILRVTSDELEQTARGGPAQDMLINGPTVVQLRAERDANSDGRVYTIRFAVSDSSGNTTPAACRVEVPPRPGLPASDSGVVACVGTGC